MIVEFPMEPTMKLTIKRSWGDSGMMDDAIQLIDDLHSILIPYSNIF